MSQIINIFLSDLGTSKRMRSTYNTFYIFYLSKKILEKRNSMDLFQNSPTNKILYILEIK